MGYAILNKQILSADIQRLVIKAPAIARCAEPGQFVSICPEPNFKNIPLTIIDADPIKETITLIVQQVGLTSRKLAELSLNDKIYSIVGPLGKPSQIAKHGTVVCIATGIGAAQILPICRAFQKAGNKVIGIVGAKTKKALMVESQMRIACDKIFIATNDGSYERRGLATDVLVELLQKTEVHLVYAIGSTEMMKQVCRLTKEKNIPTRVQLNPWILDGNGMCGSCRVRVGNKTVLACIDGPEFDGHSVDFNDAEIRMKVLEGMNQWQNPKFQFKKQPLVGRIFKRFLLGTPKK